MCVAVVLVAVVKYPGFGKVKCAVADIVFIGAGFLHGRGADAVWADDGGFFGLVVQGIYQGLEGF